MGVRVTGAAVRISYPLRFITLFFVALAWGLAAWLVLGVWLKGSGSVITVTAVTALTAGLIVGCLRALGSGLRMDGSGVTVRNFWRTYKMSWPEVSHLGDGSVQMGDAGKVWALGVVLRDGRIRNVSTAVGLSATEREEVRQAAARYAVSAKITVPTEATETRMRDERPAEGLYEDPGGLVGLRYWDGSFWSPLLPPSMRKGRPVWKSNPAWAALSVAPERWVPLGIETAQAKARRAQVWVRLCAVPTAAVPAAGVVTALLSGNWLWAVWLAPFDLLPGMFLIAAWVIWSHWSDEVEVRQIAFSAERPNDS